MRSLRHSLVFAAVAALAVLLWAAPASAATVANPGPVTLSSGSAGDPAQLGGIDFMGFSAAGTADSDGALVFPAEEVDFPVIEVAPVQGGTPEVTGGQITIAPTHAATGTIDPAAGTAALHARGLATGVINGSALGIAFTATCPIGSVANPIVLPLSTEPLSPSGLDVPVPYAQATGTATLVGRIDLPTIDANACAITGSPFAAFLDAVKGVIIGQFAGTYDNLPVALAARFSPALHAPGFTPPSTLVPTVPAVPNLAQAPSNLFTVGAAALSSSKGSATLTLDLPGPGTVKALATANLPAGAAKKITVAKLTRQAARAGRLKLTLKPSKAALRHLRRRGKLRTSVKLTYTPTGGSARSVIRKVTLKLKRKRKSR